LLATMRNRPYPVLKCSSKEDEVNHKAEARENRGEHAQRAGTTIVWGGALGSACGDQAENAGVEVERQCETTAEAVGGGGALAPLWAWAERLWCAIADLLRERNARSG